MSEPGMSEGIKIFSSNKEVIKLVNKLWNLTNRNNSQVEYILTLCTGKTEDDVIVKLEHEIDKLEQDKSKIGGVRKRRRVTKKRKGKSSKKSKKSRKNKKSSKKRK
jgi:hypothetical protein